MIEQGPKGTPLQYNNSYFNTYAENWNTIPDNEIECKWEDVISYEERLRFRQSLLFLQEQNKIPPIPFIPSISSTLTEYNIDNKNPECDSIDNLYSRLKKINGIPSSNESNIENELFSNSENWNIISDLNNNVYHKEDSIKHSPYKENNFIPTSGFETNTKSASSFNNTVLNNTTNYINTPFKYTENVVESENNENEQVNESKSMNNINANENKNEFVHHNEEYYIAFIEKQNIIV